MKRPIAATIVASQDFGFLILGMDKNLDQTAASRECYPSAANFSNLLYRGITFFPCAGGVQPSISNNKQRRE
jgi:hypothetical protein